MSHRARGRNLFLGGSALVAGCLLASGCGDEPTPEAIEEGRTLPPATAPTGLELEDLDVDVDQPIDIAVRGDSLLVAERAGRVVELRPDGDGSYEVAGEVVDFVDDVGDAEGERGLLGVEVHPDGSRMFVNHTRADDGATVIAEYPLDGEAGSLAAGERDELLVVRQPFPNHNGGDLAWGTDGYLYVGMGDGGAGGDPEGVAQRLDSPLGKILRIDPDAEDLVPPDNPYAEVGDGVDPLIWARGVRNPWRIAVDRASGDLWVADVGQEQWEEINVLPPGSGGADLGWDRTEGTEEYPDAGPTEGWPDDDATVVAPIHVYPHDGRCAVIGGFPYQGTALPTLRGRYLFSDSCDGVLRSVDRSGEEVLDLQVQRDGVVSINPDENGEPLVLSPDGIARLRGTT